MPGKAEEGQQLRQIPRQLTDHAGIVSLPRTAESAKRGLVLLAILGLIDGLGLGFDLVVITTAYFLQNIAHLVHPAALMQGARIHRLDGGGQTGQPSVTISSRFCPSSPRR